jgi:ssDNA-binding replication factor A large subunit
MQPPLLLVSDVVNPKNKPKNNTPTPFNQLARNVTKHSLHLQKRFRNGVQVGTEITRWKINGGGSKFGSLSL